MRIVKEGDTRQVICHHCGKTTATYLLRNVDFSDQRGTVKNILVAVCNKCNSVVSIPSQSTPRVKAEFNKTKRSLEIRIPAHYLDILNIATRKINSALDESFNRALILYYVHAITSGRYEQANLAMLLETDLAKAKSSKRISMKISEKQLNDLNTIMESQKLKKNTDVVKAVIMKINDDIVQEGNPEHLSELRNVAAAFI